MQFVLCSTGPDLDAFSSDSLDYYGHADDEGFVMNGLR